MVTAAIIRMVTTLPPDLGHPSHPAPSLHQEGGPGTPGHPAPVPGPAPPMVTVIRMGRRSRERRQSTETGHRGRLHPIMRTRGGRSILMTGEGVGTIIMRTGEGQMTTGVTRTGEHPAVTGRTGEGAETTLREESHQTADTRPHPMAEDTEDPGAENNLSLSRQHFMQIIL